MLRDRLGRRRALAATRGEQSEQEPSLTQGRATLEPRTGLNAGHFGLLVDAPAQLEEAFQTLTSRALTPERRGPKLWIEDPDGNGWEILVTP